MRSFAALCVKPSRPKRSKKLSPEDDLHPQDNQSSASDDTQAEIVEPAPKKRNTDGKGKKTFPEHLPRKVVTIPIDPSTLCACGCGRRRLPPGIYERMEVIPAKLVVIQEEHEKSACRNCGSIAYARSPDRTFDWSRYGSSLTVAAMMDKFADGLPYHRQAERYKRLGMEIKRSTLMRLADRGGSALPPIFDLMRADLTRSAVLHMDETPLPQLDPGRGKVKIGYLWTLLREQRSHAGNQPPCVVFQYAGSRAGLHAEEILRDFSGVLHVDAYAGYKRLTASDRDGGAIALSYCWAHVRRKFRELTRTDKNKTAQRYLEHINAMFSIERRIKGKSPAERQAVRQRDTLPIVDEFFADMKSASMSGLRKSPLGQAMAYALALEDGFRLFTHDGRLEISNNPVENVIRHVAIVRKNALFAGSEVGGQNWAIIQSIISACKLNGLDPEAYLEWMFEQMQQKLPISQYEKLLPWNCPLPRHYS